MRDEGQGEGRKGAQPRGSLLASFSSVVYRPPAPHITFFHHGVNRDNKVAMRMPDGSTMTLPPPSFVVNALEHLELRPGRSFLDVGCGTGYVSALAACLLLGDARAGTTGAVCGVECVGSRLEQARSNIKALRDRLTLVASAAAAAASSSSEAAGPSSSSLVAAPVSPGAVTAPLSCPSPTALALAGSVLGDPHKALSCVDLSLSNVSVGASEP